MNNRTIQEYKNIRETELNFFNCFKKITVTTK